VGHHHAIPPAAGSSRRLAVVLALTAAYALAEVAGGVLSGSLALLADAGHMVTDVMALALALFAAWSARRPPDPARTYGYQRAEILAALVNGVVLILIAVMIFVEAWKRLAHPPEVEAGLMGGVAAGGLLVNIVAAWILHGDHGMNQRAAFLHVLGDLLGSVGALTAAVLIWAFDWTWADPAASALIGAFIVAGAVRLVLEALNVLMEGAPSHLDTRDIEGCLGRLAGVAGVHDLHVWTLGGRTPLLTAHLVLDHSRPAGVVLRQATELLRRDYGIEHSTLQLEPADFNIVVDLAAPEPADELRR